jgi:soluble lytic murein transglycosylase
MNLQHLVAGLALALGLLCPPALVAAQPSQASAQQLLAQSLNLVQAGLVTEALPSLRQLYASPSRHELDPVWQRRLPFLLGYLYIRSGDYSKATLHFERARENYPELQDYTLWYLGESLLHLERTQAARTAFQWLLDAFPESVHRPEALFKAAEANARLGELPRADDLYQTYQRQYPHGMHHGEVHLRLGMVRRDMGDAQAALREWRHLWVEHPEDPAAASVPALEHNLPATVPIAASTSDELYRRADRLYHLNRHREAIQAFELALALTPGQAVATEVLQQIGMAQYHARENNAAVDTFRQLYERAPQGPLAPLALLMQVRLHLREELDNDVLGTARALIAQFPGSKQADEVSYLLAHFYRNRGRIGDALQAFQRVAEGGKRSEFADDAWWYLGWLQYGERDYERAAQTWEKLLRAFPASKLVPDTLYWQGRALERAGRSTEARARFERLRTSYPQTYYGSLASARLEGRSSWSMEAKKGAAALGNGGGSISILQLPPVDVSNPHAVRGAELWTMRLFAQAGEEFQAAAENGGDGSSYQLRAARAFHWAGEHHRAMSILRQHSSTPFLQSLGLSAADLQEMTYPLGALQRLDAAALVGLDPLFIGALIMAESDWNPHAFSRVGARGLMQLMPETGRRLAQSIGVELVSDEQLFEPRLNLRLGMAYLRELLQRFDGRLPLVIASYNAGEQQVSKWWTKRGGGDLDEFIADIPFRETRRYVQRVFVYYREYQRIYRGAQD